VKIIPLLKWSTLATLQDSQKNTQTLQTIFPVICFGSWARKLAANVRVSALTDLTA